MCETIYVTSSYAKLVKLIEKCMKQPNGVVYMAAKSYYFGTGGSVEGFLKFLEQTSPGLKFEMIREIKESVHCSIVKIYWR